MLKTRTMKFLLLTVSIWGLSACSKHPRVITINENRTRPVTQPVITEPIKRPVIKEEILLGQGSKNPRLGDRVDVPKNNPILDGTISPDENISTDTTIGTRSEVIERIDFPTEEYRYVKKRGRSTVSGTIYLENSHTTAKVTGNKIKLWLNPVTSYSRQWYEESYLGGYKLSKTDKRLYNYLKFTYSDSSGKFNFFGVPAGDYYLTGSISCSEECGFNQIKSIRLVREVSVGSGVTRVDLMKHVP
jgi:hypothetical protein